MTFASDYSIVVYKINCGLEPVFKEVADTIVVQVIIGTFFLVFISFVLYLINGKSKKLKNTEVPMDRVFMVLICLFSAILHFVFNFGSNLIAGICLQAQDHRFNTFAHLNSHPPYTMPEPA